MHPAFTVIFFTTASGAGYGLLALLGVLAPLGLVPRSLWFGVAALGLASALITTGLLASTAHLGHPERAWRALTQWRSSWLSREGIAALVTYLPAGLFAVLWAFPGLSESAFALAGLGAAAMAIVTVYCTGMIYASLKPVHQWHNSLVVPNYLALALMSGALWLQALVHAWAAPTLLITGLTVTATALAVWLKQRHWRLVDTTRGPSSPASAIGHARDRQDQPRVRLLDPPHTEKNYLLNEMGYRIARKHAVKLRRLALGAGFAVPLLFTLLASLLPYRLAAASAVGAVFAAMAGVLIERWLFFAEAKHTVTLYYGASEA